MAAIPPLSGPPSSGVRPAQDPRAAAQRAFFEAALGRAQATAPTPPAVSLRSAPAAAPPTVAPTPAAADPGRADRGARPGSLVNIVV